MARRFYPPTHSDIPIHGWRPYSEFHWERIRAHAKHDGNQESMERRDFRHQSWLPVLVEEVGEVAKVLNDLRHGDVHQWTPEARQQLRDELIQVGAMTAAWVEAIDLDICDVSTVDGEDSCCMQAMHEGEHLSWSGRRRWTT